MRSILFWSIASGLYGFIRYHAIQDEVGIIIDSPYTGLYNGPRTVLIFCFTGSLIGILYATIEFMINRYLRLRISLALSILLQIILVFVAIILISKGIFQFVSIVNNVSIDFRPGWWYRDKTFFPILVYIPFASFVFSMFIITIDKLGHGIFLKLMIGRYKQPQEEWRIFMFLDLKGSTTIAEQIGHFKYSQLIQDCFYDLNEIVVKYDADIYQYVGDEAILTWSYAQGLTKNNCLNLFFDFQKKIESKAAIYQNKYHHIPQFKAGIHGGIVMAVEVGVIKKELSYLGDVVNTAARIQGECNRFDTNLLISEKLVDDLLLNGHFQSDFIGDLTLKGKEKQIRIHTIKELEEE